MGVARSCYTAKARFYVGGPIGTIRYFFAKPGAVVYTAPQVFHPLSQILQFKPTDGVGELCIGKRRWDKGGAPMLAKGEAVDGTADDFAGLTPYPGPIQSYQVPSCRLPPAIRFSLHRPKRAFHATLALSAHGPTTEATIAFRAERGVLREQPSIALQPASVLQSASAELPMALSAESVLRNDTVGKAIFALNAKAAKGVSPSKRKVMFGLSAKSQVTRLSTSGNMALMAQGKRDCDAAFAMMAKIDQELMRDRKANFLLSAKPSNTGLRDQSGTMAFMGSYTGSGSGSGSGPPGGPGDACDDGLVMDNGVEYTQGVPPGHPDQWFKFWLLDGQTADIAYRTNSGGDRSITWYHGACDDLNLIRGTFEPLITFPYGPHTGDEWIIAFVNNFNGDGNYTLRITAS